jgi:hypothetical protein
VQAHNFAKAIFTDIRAPCFLLAARSERRVQISAAANAVRDNAEPLGKRNIVNHVVAPKRPSQGRFGSFRPIRGQSGYGLERRAAAECWLSGRAGLPQLPDSRIDQNFPQPGKWISGKNVTVLRETSARISSLF